MNNNHDKLTDLAILRTYMSADNTLLAGIRTAVSILSFTLVLLKLYDPKRNTLQQHWMILTGIIIVSLLILIFSSYQYNKTINRIKEHKNKKL
jgi:uncharacterized membrane protein YidH (DUF202 family)